MHTNRDIESYHVRLLNQEENIEIRFYVFSEGRNIVIKYNVNLYISQKALWQWLKKWFSQEELLSKVEDDVLKGNLKVSKIPTPYDSDQFIFLGDEIFRLDRFGLCLDKKTLGHIEIKYQSLENPSNEFIINF